MTDKGIRLQKELAMPDLHKSAAKEASGKAPKYDEAVPKKMMKKGGLARKHGGSVCPICGKKDCSHQMKEK